MNRIISLLRSTFVPLLAFRLTAIGLLGCENIDNASAVYEEMADDVVAEANDATMGLR